MPPGPVSKETVLPRPVVKGIGPAIRSGVKGTSEKYEAEKEEGRERERRTGGKEGRERRKGGTEGRERGGTTALWRRDEGKM